MQPPLINIGKYLSKGALFLLLSFLSNHVFAQNPTDSFPIDPGSVSVYTIKNLAFGAFTHSAAGTVDITSAGARSVSGAVIPLNLGVPYYQAIFEIDAPQGSNISVLNGPDVSLIGSNGGSMSLHIGDCSLGNSFFTTAIQPARTQVKFGGTLTVGSSGASPPGTYTGTFSITFNNE